MSGFLLGGFLSFVAGPIDMLTAKFTLVNYVPSVSSHIVYVANCRGMSCPPYRPCSVSAELTILIEPPTTAPCSSWSWGLGAEAAFLPGVSATSWPSHHAVGVQP